MVSYPLFFSKVAQKLRTSVNAAFYAFFLILVGDPSWKLIVVCVILRILALILVDLGERRS